jgi:hypothetical protein
VLLLLVLICAYTEAGFTSDKDVGIPYFSTKSSDEFQSLWTPYCLFNCAKYVPGLCLGRIPNSSMVNSASGRKFNKFDVHVWTYVESVGGSQKRLY